MIITLQDFTPPPTEPEQAPTKAPTSKRNETDSGQSEVSDVENPVVVIIETE